jgi:hypothetical protein
MTTPRRADLQQDCSADVPESDLPVYSLRGAAPWRPAALRASGLGERGLQFDQPDLVHPAEMQ